MKGYIYCKRWARAFKDARDPMSEIQAKKIHEKLYGKANQPKSGQKFPMMQRSGVVEYTVLVGSLEKPEAFVHFVSNAIFVVFLDHALRSYLEYSFQISENGTYF